MTAKHALCCVLGNYGDVVVLYAGNPRMDDYIRDCGPHETGLPDPPGRGVWIWEGSFGGGQYMAHAGDYADVELIGTFRRMNNREAGRLFSGISPFDEIEPEPARCGAWMYLGQSWWTGDAGPGVPPLPHIADGQRCILPDGHQGDHRLATIDELIARSSIGAGLANIRDNGIDAELAYLESQPSFRIHHRGTRKKPTTTRKKPGIAPKKPKARKKR